MLVVAVVEGERCVVGCGAVVAVVGMGWVGAVGGCIVWVASVVGVGVVHWLLGEGGWLRGAGWVGVGVWFVGWFRAVWRIGSWVVWYVVGEVVSVVGVWWLGAGGMMLAARSTWERICPSSVSRSAMICVCMSFGRGFGARV